MERERFWVGTAMAAVPVVFVLLTMAPRVEVLRSGPIEGHVSIQGRPLAGGYILFVPEDSNSDWGAGLIDEQGHFTMGPGWRRKVEKGETSFRICLLPKPREGSGEAARGPDWAEAATTWAEIGPGTKAVTNVAAGFLQRLSDPSTTNLKVRLDSGPAQIDIAL
jgi:hypothetical protein